MALKGTMMFKLFLAAIIGVWATTASAHSPLESTFPKNNSLIEEMPSEILLNFKGEIRLTRVTLVQSDNPSVDLDLSGTGGFNSEYTLPIQEVGNGTYEIKWRGLGADGHAMNGSFSFTVK